MTASGLAGWAVAEAAVGIAIGVPVAFVLEAFGLAAQVLGLQAGYAYASTIDPNTQADSGILLVLAQLMAGMLFFALGLDRQVLRLFADSLEQIPAGAYLFGPRLRREPLIHLGAGLFSVGVRLALPVVALLADGGCGAGPAGPPEPATATALAGLSGQDADRAAGAELAGAVCSRASSWQFSGQAWAAARRMLGI